MAMAAASPEEESYEGIVTFCDENRALVWIEGQKWEQEVSFAYRHKRFDLGDWVLINSRDEIYRIEPCLETRVLDAGIVQVRTEIKFGDSDEKIRHGTVVQSRHFGRVSVFTPFSGIVPGNIYSVFIERIPRDQRWYEMESGTHWFVSSNQVVRCARKISNVGLLGPLTGIVVSKGPRHTFVWTPTLGEGICENHNSLAIGEWISFMADTPGDNIQHVNINFKVAHGWTLSPGVLPSVPCGNNLMLKSKICISKWPMENLEADWVGTIIDRFHILKEAVHRFGVGKTFMVMLKRLKKSLEEPITVWSVVEVLKVENGFVKSGIICFVDVQKSLVYAYIPEANSDNGRELRINLELFDNIPELGDWYLFEINDSALHWTVKSAVKSNEKLCAVRECQGHLEIKMEVVLTDRHAADGSRIAFSKLFGIVKDDKNKLPNVPATTSEMYVVWCTTTKAAAPGDPRWKIIRYFPSLTESSEMAMKSIRNEDASNNSDDFSYVGIVVSESTSNRFIWTPPLGEGICRLWKDLHIGDWIRFWIFTDDTQKFSGNLHFDVRKWEKIDSLYPACQSKKTAVVTIEVPIPQDHVSLRPPKVPFFGEILDKSLYFGANIDAIRGHKVMMDLRRVKKSVSEPVTAWNITYIKVMEPLQNVEDIPETLTETNTSSAVDVPSAMSSVEGTKSFFAPERFLRASDNRGAEEQEGYVSYGQKSYGSSHSSDHNNESQEKDEGYEDTDDLDEDNARLDPVICSMRLLLMSNEVREAIKVNCKEEYEILCNFYGIVP